MTDLATAFAEHGFGDHHEPMARHVLRHTAGGIKLLGIGPEPNRVVCFDPVYCCVYRAPVSRLGVHPTEAEVDWRSVADPHGWIDAADESLLWIHPQFRVAPTRETNHWPYRLETCPITPNI